MTAPLRTADMTSYLAATGWQALPERWRGATIWQHPSGHQTLVPARDGLDDAAERTEDLLRILAQVESRPPGAISEDIARPEDDTPFVRTHPDNLPPGEISLAEAVRAVTGVRVILAAAARAVVDGSRPAFVGNHPPEVTRLLEQVRLGPTKPGSYVFDLRVPAAPEPEAFAPLFDLAEPEPSLTRRALVGLFRGIGSAHGAATAVQRGTDYSAFDSSVEDGVSANLCRGLSALAGLKRDRPFEIGFRWARALPAGLPNQTLEFPSGSGLILYRAAKQLDDLANGGNADIAGVIESLHDDQAGDDRWRIRVRGILRSPTTDFQNQRAVWIRLDQADYQRAIDAHRDHRPVRAHGELHLIKHRVELTASSFEVGGT